MRNVILPNTKTFISVKTKGPAKTYENLVVEVLKSIGNYTDQKGMDGFKKSLETATDKYIDDVPARHSGDDQYGSFMSKQHLHSTSFAQEGIRQPNHIMPA